MSVRVTIGLAILLLVVILVGVLVTVNRGRSTPTRAKPPEGAIYRVPEDSLRTITITSEGKRETFLRDAEGKWPVPKPPIFRDWVLVLQAE